MKVTNAIAHVLKTEGVEFLIVYPVNPIIEGAAEADIRTIMVRQEAKREADRKLQAIIRGSRPAGNRDVATLHPLMDELVKETPQQIAWMRILDMSGKEIAASGKTARHSHLMAGWELKPW